jgi:FkbH-like protein
MAAVKKCLVWDLDNTLWDGVCLEGSVSIKKDVLYSLTEMDNRGIINSIASRGDEELSMNVLKKNKIDELFLVPQINWLPKSQNIMKISNELGFPLNAMAFIDDDEFEREQIKYMLPDVLTIEADKAKDLPYIAEFSPGKITGEAKQRRHFYMAELNRRKMSNNYDSREEFLISCEMRLNIRVMNKKDIPRVLELMTRTHQLNTTGLTLGQDELSALLRRNGKMQNITVAELEDKFGKYGIIGCAITETKGSLLNLKYLALSCRVMGRGIERANDADSVPDDGF